MLGKAKRTEKPERKKRKSFFGHLGEELVSLSKPSPSKTVCVTIGVIAGAYVMAFAIGVVDLLITDVIRLFL